MLVEERAVLDEVARVLADDGWRYIIEFAWQAVRTSKRVSASFAARFFLNCTVAVVGSRFVPESVI